MKNSIVLDSRSLFLGKCQMIGWKFDYINDEWSPSEAFALYVDCEEMGHFTQRHLLAYT